ncbi:MAG: 3-dehydroquinate synthase [Lewinellaceae bacterium]|nr:3-dehydroquinate synthase [Lewinellaceae bacterium]
MYVFHPGDYFVQLGDLRATFPAWLKKRIHAQIAVLADEHTLQYCLPVFEEKTGLRLGENAIVIPAGEQHKSLSMCTFVWNAMLEAGLDRKALLINLGGGVIGDMGGFCAATWKRGIDFVQVPTTLLGMTDAAIGGKLGIDFQGVKNTIGVFCEPAGVFVDPVFLDTLPERELRSGFAEVIKHALIGDPALWKAINAKNFKLGKRPNAQDGLSYMDLLRASIEVKARVVKEDPYEKGLRALLNFGHTVGHTLESYFLETTEPLTHGEAVAIGIICETCIGAGKKHLDKVAELILKHFPHRPIPMHAADVLLELMRHDKKNASGKVRMAIPGRKPFSMKILAPRDAEIRRSLEYYNSLGPSL